MSDDAMEHWAITKTIPQLVSDELNLSHVFFDMNEQDRIYKGIFSEADIRMKGFSGNQTEIIINENIRKNYDKREYEWVENISQLPNDPILIICGYDHPRSFQKKALNRNLDAHIVNENWKPDMQN